MAKYRNEVILKAIEKSDGTLTDIGRHLNPPCKPSRLMRYVDVSREIQQAIEDRRQEVQDEMISILYKKIRDGDLRAIEVYYRIKPSLRGGSRRGSDDNSIPVEVISYAPRKKKADKNTVQLHTERVSAATSGGDGRRDKESGLRVAQESGKGQDSSELDSEEDD